VCLPATSDLPPRGPAGAHGTSQPLARRARPVPPRRPPWPTGPATRGTSPGRGRARRGPKPAHDLRPLVNGLVASHGWESPVSHPSHSRVLPDQPVNGGLACAGRGSAAPRTGPAPRIQWRGDFRCAGVPRPDPQRQVGYLVPVPSDRPAPGRGRAIGSRYWRPGPPLPLGPSPAARKSDVRWDRPRPKGVHLCALACCDGRPVSRSAPWRSPRVRSGRCTRAPSPMDSPLTDTPSPRVAHAL